MNTLSAECQSMVQRLGQLHWHRLFVGRALWHAARAGKVGSPTRQLPFCGCHQLQILMYDTVTKCRHSSAHVDDKRTAIDLTILKSDLARQQGQARWVQGVNICQYDSRFLKEDVTLVLAKNHGAWTMQVTSL